MDIRTHAEAISNQVSQALEGSAVVVDDVSVKQAGRRRLVRIFVARDVRELLAQDGPEEGISSVEPLSLDEIADVTRLISDALDASDVMGEAAYTLEVSSPGVDRPLSTPPQFRRNVGRLLDVKHADGTRTTGRLHRASAAGIALADAPDTLIGWEQISSATVQVEFSRPEGKDL